MNHPIHLTALQAAADAGDAESQFRIAEHHISKCSFAKNRDGAVRVLHKAHWQSALTHLNKAVRAGHPEARMLMGSYLFKGHPALEQRRVLGAAYWLLGWIQKVCRNPADIRSRLLALAKNNPSADRTVKPIYTNVPYFGGIGSNTLATCRVRISMEAHGNCHVVIENTGPLTGPSVTNSAEQIATRALYQLWIDGVDVLPEKIHWYEAYPAHPDAMHPDGSIVGIAFAWDGATYHRPQWLGRPKHAVPVDLSDILMIEGN